MGVIGFLRDMFVPTVPGPIEARGDSIDDLISRLRPSTGVWRSASVREALGVPSIFRAASLIATTTGALSMQAYRRGILMDPEDRPMVMVRPDPFRKPRAFYRDTAWNMATRGEAVWWVAKRDSDGNASALLTIPPHEVVREDNPNDLRFPDVTWRNLTTKRPLPANMKEADHADFRFLPFVQEPGELRGVGPLQLCGAAVSVAVESQEFAANFYADGGYPSVLVKSARSLSPLPDPSDGLTEADRLRAQWTDAPNNVPKIIDNGIESIDIHEPDTARVQMLQARDYQNGEAARMFGIPGSLLDYSTPGSSLTYQNLEGEFTKWVRGGLWPYFLEEIEQEMSDLLPRSTVGRFNVDALLRADLKTRYEVYSLGVASGVLTAELAQQKEGIVPGDVENAPVPFTSTVGIPEVRSIDAVRCDGLRTLKGVIRPCGKLLAEAGPFVGTCPRCSKVHAAA
jgi:phage portal protein BeeE